MLSLFYKRFQCPSNIQRLHCACALYKIACGHPFDLLVHDCCGHRKNANYFSLTHTRSRRQLCVHDLPPLSWLSYTVLLVHTRTHSVCSLSALPSLPAAFVVVAAVDAVCWLAACLFRLSDTDTFAALTHSALLCVLCVLFDGLAVHSFVRFASAALCMHECVCVCVCLCLCCRRCCLSFRFALLALAVRCVAFACLVQLLQLNFSSVFYRRRSQYILFSVHSVHSVQFSARLIFRPCRAKSEVNTAPQQQQQQE